MLGIVNGTARLHQKTSAKWTVTFDVIRYVGWQAEELPQSSMRSHDHADHLNRMYRLLTEEVGGCAPPQRTSRNTGDLQGHQVWSDVAREIERQKQSTAEK